MDCPCRNCNDRHVSCHSDCDKYIEWRTQLNAVNEQVRRARGAFYMCEKVHNESVRRALKRKRGQK